MEERQSAVQQPGKAYGPAAKAFIGIMSVFFALGALVALVSAEYFGALTMGGLAAVCIYALITGREVHDGAPEPRKLEPCPCCATPVLNAGWPSQNCLICEWEVGEGAENLGYTLARARDNFRRNGVYYEAEDGETWGAREITADEKAAKSRVIKILNDLQASEDRKRSADLWKEFESLESELYRYRRVQPEHGA